MLVEVAIRLAKVAAKETLMVLFIVEEMNVLNSFHDGAFNIVLRNVQVFCHIVYL